MQKTYQEEFRLRAYECDFQGTWRPSAILEEMQEAAGTHAGILGVGREALIKQNLVWVVSRNEVLMDRYPRFNEIVRVETFPYKPRRWLLPRYYIFRDENGERLGCAGSIWLLLDVNERKMIAPDPVLPYMPDNSDLPAPLGLPPVVADITCEQVEHGQITPVYTDLDMNWHVNNAKYLDWCCNAIGTDIMGKNVMRHFCINYTSEVRSHMTVDTELKRNGNFFTFTGRHEDNRHFDIGGEFAPRC